MSTKSSKEAAILGIREQSSRARLPRVRVGGFPELRPGGRLDEDSRHLGADGGPHAVDEIHEALVLHPFDALRVGEVVGDAVRGRDASGRERERHLREVVVQLVTDVEREDRIQGRAGRPQARDEILHVLRLGGYTFA
jgi:hypothetical protein